MGHPKLKQMLQNISYQTGQHQLIDEDTEGSLSNEMGQAINSGDLEQRALAFQ